MIILPAVMEGCYESTFTVISRRYSVMQRSTPASGPDHQVPVRDQLNAPLLEDLPGCGQGEYAQFRLPRCAQPCLGALQLAIVVARMANKLPRPIGNVSRDGMEQLFIERSSD